MDRVRRRGSGGRIAGPALAAARVRARHSLAGRGNAVAHDELGVEDGAMTRRTHASVCPHDCPSTCAVEVATEEGRIVDVVGDRTHPFTRGVICGKVHDYGERVYSPLRVLHPMRR